MSVRISYAFKAESISTDKQGSGDKRAMASAGDGSHESNCPWTSDRTQLPIDVSPLSCLFTLKAKGPNTKATNWPAHGNSSVLFCFAIQHLLDFTVAAAEEDNKGTNTKVKQRIFHCSFVLLYLHEAVKSTIRHHYVFCRKFNTNMWWWWQE